MAVVTTALKAGASSVCVVPRCVVCPLLLLLLLPPAAAAATKGEVAWRLLHDASLAVGKEQAVLLPELRKVGHSQTVSWGEGGRGITDVGCSV